MKFQKDDSLMFLDYVKKGDVELVEDDNKYDIYMLTNKAILDDYVCECQSG